METKIRTKRRSRTSDGKPNPLDVQIGRRIRLRRQNLAYSQDKLGQLAGLTFQQIQKYECGKNRISASRLWDFSRILNVPITYFFMDMENEAAADASRSQSSRPLLSTAEIEMKNPFFEEKSMLLMNAYNSISNKDLADKFLKLLLSVSSRYINKE